VDLLEVIAGRRSCRAFKPDVPSRDVLEAVLQTAARAPSAVNLQPWRVWVVQGEELHRLRRGLLRAYRERNIGCSPGGGRTAPAEDDWGPGSFREIAKIVEARGQSFGSFINEGSCRFYEAPVGIVCFLEADAPAARRLDCGLWLAYLLLGAEAHGLATCPVGLLAAYADIVRDCLYTPGDYEFACAVALGYSKDDPVNAVSCPRKGIESVEWLE
jgi:nitroreductase